MRMWTYVRVRRSGLGGFAGNASRSKVHHGKGCLLGGVSGNAATRPKMTPCTGPDTCVCFCSAAPAVQWRPPVLTSHPWASTVHAYRASFNSNLWVEPSLADDHQRLSNFLASCIHLIVGLKVQPLSSRHHGASDLARAASLSALSHHVKP